MCKLGARRGTRSALHPPTRGALGTWRFPYTVSGAQRRLTTRSPCARTCQTPGALRRGGGRAEGACGVAAAAAFAGEPARVRGAERWDCKGQRCYRVTGRVTGRDRVRGTGSRQPAAQPCSTLTAPPWGLQLALLVALSPNRPPTLAPQRPARPLHTPQRPVPCPAAPQCLCASAPTQRPRSSCTTHSPTTPDLQPPMGPWLHLQRAPTAGRRWAGWGPPAALNPQHPRPKMCITFSVNAPPPHPPLLPC
jgi:hypothetical protein